MPTTPKIRLIDDCAQRTIVDKLLPLQEQVLLAQWSLATAKHILLLTRVDYAHNAVLVDAFAVNERWQHGNARVQDVRQAGLRIHALARACPDKAQQAALRAAGHAVSSGHMREHAMVASDYAVKAINLLHPGDPEAAAAERRWQLLKLAACRAEQN